MLARLDAAGDVLLLRHLGAELGHQVARLRQHRQLLVQQLLPLRRVRCNTDARLNRGIEEGERLEGCSGSTLSLLANSCSQFSLCRLDDFQFQ